MQEKGSVAARIRPVLIPIAQQLGVVIWDVKFVKEGAVWFLRILIDKDSGDIDVDTCADFSRLVSKELDETDPIEDMYYLEVSSAGIERDISTDDHFCWAVGKPLSVKLFAPIDGEKEFVGELKEKNGKEITLLTQQGDIKIDISKAAYIRLWDEKISGGIKDE